MGAVTPEERLSPETRLTPENRLTSQTRRLPQTRLSPEERLKYETAQELGLLPKLQRVGWAGLSAAESGRIGGLMGARLKQRRKENACTPPSPTSTTP